MRGSLIALGFTLASACTFDPGGTLLGAGSGAPIDGAAATDGTPSPIDAGSIDADLLLDASAGCGQQGDCPGALCCSYAGGLATACSPTCLGGNQVCEQTSDCPDSNDACCASPFGPDVCTFVCF